MKNCKKPLILKSPKIKRTESNEEKKDQRKLNQRWLTKAKHNGLPF